MSTIIKLSEWILEVETEKNLGYYKNIPSIQCCPNCDNYIAAINRMPRELNELFNKLGVIPEKAINISHLTGLENNMHLYNPTYFIVGNILSTPREKNCTYAFNEDFEVYFGEKMIAPIGTKNFPKPTFQFDIICSLPWVLI